MLVKEGIAIPDFDAQLRTNLAWTEPITLPTVLPVFTIS